MLLVCCPLLGLLLVLLVRALEDGKVIYERPYLSTYDQWEAPQEGTPPFRRMAKPVLAAINTVRRSRGSATT